MEITKVFVDQNQVLGNEVFVSGMEEVRANDYNPVSYRIFEISSRKEPSAFLIVEGFKMSDVPEGVKRLSFLVELLLNAVTSVLEANVNMKMSLLRKKCVR